ncbi:HET-domain-containing protein [Pyrenochaeta sp. DS3sAY3a]|nr:HET-domain-containing protein [Pyrenochaeta sp. DS3sAY3a]
MDFRLVRVLAERTSRVKCELELASLDHPPPYLSISYAWGDGMDMTNLRLNGRNKSVPTSLYSALEAVREKDKDVLVWIDGLSIDQQNKAERASQVRLMSFIYSRASSMAIWLGPNADNSELALALLERVAQKRVSKSRITDLENKDSVALRTLFKRPYWSRLWVVQEVYLSPVKWVYCGSSRLPWQAYEDTSNAFWEDEIDPHLRKGPSSFPNMDSLVGQGADRLLEVLCACRKKISENPRDKVFGIMGMLPEETRKELPVNYDQSVKSLFIDVADHIISSTRRLDVIRESIHYPLHVSAADLPSWCPEWSHIPDVSALREWTFSAAGGTDAVYRFYDHERKLEISGLELGTIGATGLPVGTLCAMQNYLMSFLHWHALLLDTANIEADDMHNPTLENFCRTLSLGQVPERWEKGGWAIPCLHAFAVLLMERMPRLPIDRSLQAYARLAVQLGDGYEGDHRSFVQENFGDRMMGRTFCTTTNGLMGMGSGFMARGDVVVVALGCDTPILLRKEGCSDEFRYVGDVYIHGYMHGEVLAEGKRSVTKFKLR